MGKLGLTPVRTARTIATIIALMGVILLTIMRVLSVVLAMAQDAIKLGLARYNNFTGRFASQNFAEDKQLLKLLKEVQGILPTAETALTVLLVVSIVLLVIALIGLALPRQFTHVLVAIRVLKWQPEWKENQTDEVSHDIGETMKKLGETPVKKLAIPIVIVLAVILVVWAISGVASKVVESSNENELENMQQQALSYIEAQKSYFSRTKKIGGASALQLPDTLSTDAFEYKISATRFTATSKAPFGNCPSGSRWIVSASVKGFFSQELSLYRGLPKDTNCVALTPEYKNLGRNKPTK